MGRTISLLAVAVCLAVLAGCETTAGIGKGIACGVASTAEGAGEDIYNSVAWIPAADNWIKKNLW